ncbi:hypothetical protein Achl_1098 [Pseudarthrobacter chlorophenolicus A6]|uniref:Uncharacterized protein n=1 Tax=Pseudarthrobacter chlorophenolicus (strain ATCC 700700 / DSM 12829 / CIP 107037 / JCM 12360 / KCTC 9906 / NCIMB 13794 / A6) TaxID=452863 RepID=B8HE56_PSECP|nr:hypothetical protein Achl_1098 [Pseudarthrobacter chlorophenolicus A6]SDR04548.1 hypothetical protein SAMN04489738_4429 [Pseudarthrobacter chlorophenolicus]
MKTENTTLAPGTAQAGTALEPETEPAGTNTAPHRTGRRKQVLGVLVAGVLLAGGTSFGTTLPDPKYSEADKGMADVNAGVESERDSLRSDYDSLKSGYEALQAGIVDKEAKVQARETDVCKAESAEAAVKKREEAVTAAEKQKPPTRFPTERGLSARTSPPELPCHLRRGIQLLLGHLLDRQQRQQHHRNRHPGRSDGPPLPAWWWGRPARSRAG